MARIEINWKSDWSSCETCGGGGAEGGVVRITDGQSSRIIDIPASLIDQSGTILTPLSDETINELIRKEAA